MALRVIFMGTPHFAVPTLEALHAAGHAIVAVYTQPPRPAGRRGLETVASPVAIAASRLGIPVANPVSLRSAAEQAAMRALDADVAVVVAYGLILPAAILASTKLGCFNGHASLLPRWRGAAPIQRAIMAGDRETGVMIMKMDEGLDTGPTAMAERVAILPDMTAGELGTQLMAITARLMVVALSELASGTLTLRQQPTEGVTYAQKIDKSEARILWSQSAQEVHNRIRGLSPSPGAWCEMSVSGSGERLKLLRSTLADGAGEPGEIVDDRLTAACGSGAVRLLEVQRAGGRPVAAQEFLRGAKIGKGTKLS